MRSTPLDERRVVKEFKVALQASGSPEHHSSLRPYLATGDLDSTLVGFLAIGISVVGALDYASGRLIWQTAPSKDGATCVAFLDHLAAALPRGPLLVVLDTTWPAGMDVLAEASAAEEHTARCP